MYKILTDKNEVLGYVDTPNYVRKTVRGVTPCTPVEGRGITFKGQIYNLLGWNEWPGNPTAYPSMVTDAEMLEIANAKTTQTVHGMESLLGAEQTRQEALELRRALQSFVKTTIPVEDEAQVMEYASIYPTWGELLATKQSYPAKTIFSWGLTTGGDKQLWSFISDYTPQEIYTPDQDISHYKKVGVTDDGYDVWSQPLCAEDAWKLGDIVWHKGQLWIGTQADAAGNITWEPGVYGWEPYNPEPTGEDGSLEHPFTASRGMEYEYGKYYLDPEDGKTYLCKRTGEAEGGKITLQYLPHELIGQYFEGVTA